MLLLGKKFNGFEPNKCKGKDKPNLINPSFCPILIFSSSIDPDQITGQVTHDFFKLVGSASKRNNVSALKCALPLSSTMYTDLIIYCHHFLQTHTTSQARLRITLACWRSLSITNFRTLMFAEGCLNFQAN
jgi:hypothetical protein